MKVFSVAVHVELASLRHVPYLFLSVLFPFLFIHDVAVDYIIIILSTLRYIHLF